MTDSLKSQLGGLSKLNDWTFETINECRSRDIHGPKDFANIIWKLNSELPFLPLTQSGISRLIELAYKVSLKKEESRYPCFQIYVPINNLDPLNGSERNWLIRFKKPVLLDVSTLHRISSGIPSRPYSLAVWEEEEEQEIYAFGVIRIESHILSLMDGLKFSLSNIYPGLILSIENPATLNVLLYKDHPSLLDMIFKSLTFRAGEISFNYDLGNSSLAKNLYVDIKNSMISGIEDWDSSSDNKILKFIKNIWNYVLGLAVEFGHGGQFIILPANDSLDPNVIDIKYDVDKPNLGEQIIAFCKSIDNVNQAKDSQPSCHKYSPIGKISKPDTYIGGFKDGFQKGLLELEKVQHEYQLLLDSARAIARLSTIDGCVVFDRGLRLLGCKGEVLAKELPECEQQIHAEDELCQTIDNPMKNQFDIMEYGTRHRSAARFCKAVPGGIAFVVSQDGDIRLFEHLDNKKVGVSGPFRVIPGFSPPIVHS